MIKLYGNMRMRSEESSPDRQHPCRFKSAYRSCEDSFDNKRVKMSRMQYEHENRAMAFGFVVVSCWFGWITWKQAVSAHCVVLGEPI